MFFNHSYKWDTKAMCFQCTTDSGHINLYSDVLSEACSTHNAGCSLSCAVFSVQCAICSLQCEVCSVQCVICNIKCEMCSL